MIEACLILSSHFVCRGTDLRGADSLLRVHLNHLADHGYPFAHAKVWVWEGEYLAVVVRGRFYVVNQPVVMGQVSGPFLRWFFRGLYGKAFNLSVLRERERVASFYGVEVDILRRDGDVVFRFGGGGGSIGGEIRGERGGRLTGSLSLDGRNLFASGILLSLFASFDSSGMYASASGDVPPLLGVAFKGEGNVLRSGDSLYYSGFALPYVWYYPYRFGVGLGYAGRPALIGGTERVEEPAYDLLLMASGEDVGYRLSLRYGWFSTFAFRGVGNWRERVGGMDRFRRLPPNGVFARNFAVLRLDLHVLRFSRLRIGPFTDALFERDRKPAYAYGFSLRFGRMLSLFLSADGYFGMAARVDL